MANQYNVLYHGRRLALAYVSPHPAHTGHIIVSVIPLERKGKWEDNTLQWLCCINKDNQLILISI